MILTVNSVFPVPYLQSYMLEIQEKFLALLPPRFTKSCLLKHLSGNSHFFLLHILNPNLLYLIQSA